MCECYVLLTILSRVANDHRRFWSETKVIDGLYFNLIGREGVRLVDDVTAPPVGGVIFPLLSGISSSPPHHVAELWPIPLSVLQRLHTQHASDEADIMKLPHC